MVPLLRDAGLSALVAGEAVETLADGFVFTEGPLWCPDGSLLFQDVKAERSYRRAVVLRQEVLRERPEDPEVQTGLAQSCVNLSLLFQGWEGRRADAQIVGVPTSHVKMASSVASSLISRATNCGWLPRRSAPSVASSSSAFRALR